MTLANQNFASQANTKTVTFDSQWTTLTWTLYLPSDFDESKSYHAVVTNWSWTSIKEQMAGLYAKLFADAWFVALAFDHAWRWESVSEPRYVENPDLKTKNIIDAANYLRELSYVESWSVNGVWVCASAWYVSDAGIQWAEFNRIVLIAPWLHNASLVKKLYGWEEWVQKLIDAWKEAMKKYEESWENTVLEAASKDNWDAIMGSFDYYVNTKRGKIDAYDNKFSALSREGWLTFDPVSRWSDVTTPTLLIHSESAMVPDGAHQYADSLNDDSALIMFQKAKQDDFYDNMDYITWAVEEATRWFKS